MRVVSVPALLEQLPLEAGVAIVRDGASTIVTTARRTYVSHTGPRFRALEDIEREGGWAGYLAYDLGRAVERVVPWAAADRSIPDLCSRVRRASAFRGRRGTGRRGLDPLALLETALWSALRSRKSPRRSGSTTGRRVSTCGRALRRQ